MCDISSKGEIEERPVKHEGIAGSPSWLYKADVERNSPSRDDGMSVYFWRVPWDETEPLSTYDREPDEDDPRIVDLRLDSPCDHEWVNVQADIPERFECTGSSLPESSPDEAAEWVTDMIFEIRFKCLRCGADRLRGLPYPS